MGMLMANMQYPDASTHLCDSFIGNQSQSRIASQIASKKTAGRVMASIARSLRGSSFHQFILRDRCIATAAIVLR
jgi:hypothetical protein